MRVLGECLLAHVLCGERLLRISVAPGREQRQRPAASFGRVDRRRRLCSAERHVGSSRLGVGGPRFLVRIRCRLFESTAALAVPPLGAVGRPGRLAAAVGLDDGGPGDCPPLPADHRPGVMPHGLWAGHGQRLFPGGRDGLRGRSDGGKPDDAHRRHGAQPAVAASEHARSPADRVPGVCRMVGAVRVGAGGAGTRPPGRHVDADGPAVGDVRLGCCWASGCCSVRNGPTRNSAGAAIGVGTRWKTVRCCRG